MNILQSSINGLTVVETTPFEDERGAFARLYCEQELRDLIGSRRIQQINYSRTARVGAVRGLHYQSYPHAEMKLVRCIKGGVWDVAVDLRFQSPTFLKWYAEELTPTNNRMMVIPEGFAHGFQVLKPDSEIIYIHTAFYSPNSEGGMRHDDPMIGIEWPITVTDLSKRDAEQPFIDSNFQGVYL